MRATADELTALARHVGALGAPDRVTDATIWWALCSDDQRAVVDPHGSIRQAIADGRSAGEILVARADADPSNWLAGLALSRRFTGSMDAAMSLLPLDTWVTISREPAPSFLTLVSVSYQVPDAPKYCSGTARTPALAITVAALRLHAAARGADAEGPRP